GPRPDRPGAARAGGPRERRAGRVDRRPGAAARGAGRGPAGAGPHPGSEVVPAARDVDPAEAEARGDRIGAGGWTDLRGEVAGGLLPRVALRRAGGTSARGTTARSRCRRTPWNPGSRSGPGPRPSQSG